jgi:hypothetical protein
MPVYPAAARNASTSCASPGCRRRRARSGTAAIVTLRGSAAWDMTAPPSGVRPGRFCTGRDGGRRTDETFHSGQTVKPETLAGPVTRTEKTPRATAGASGRTPQNRLARAQRRAGLFRIRCAERSASMITGACRSPGVGGHDGGVGDVDVVETVDAIVARSTTACSPVPIAHVPAGCHSAPAFDRTHACSASSVHDAGSISALVTADKALAWRQRPARPAGPAA